MNWVTRLLLVFGLKRTESWVATQDKLPKDEDLAAAETLGASTTRSGLSLAAFGIAHAIFNWYAGTETSDRLLQQIIAVLLGLGIMFGRHALTKYNLDDVRDALRKQIGALSLVMLLLGGFAFAPAADAQTATSAPPATAQAPTTCMSTVATHPSPRSGATTASALPEPRSGTIRRQTTMVSTASRPHRQ